MLFEFCKYRRNVAVSKTIKCLRVVYEKKRDWEYLLFILEHSGAQYALKVAKEFILFTNRQ